MTYLTSLASRVLAPDVAIRPRVAGLFEPVGPRVEMSQGWLDELDEAAPPPAADWGGRPRREVPADHTDEVAEPSPARIRTVRAPATPGPVTCQPEHPVRDTGSARHPWSARPAPAAPHAAIVGRAPAAQRGPDEAGIAGPGVTATARRRATVPVAASGADQRPDRPWGSESAAAAADVDVEPPGSQRALPPVPPSRVAAGDPSGAASAPSPSPRTTLDPPVARRARWGPVSPAAPAHVHADPPTVMPLPVAPRRDRLVNRRTTPVAPTVQVTIGRIEVRATPTPVAAPRREPDRQPTMSLAEYLQGREAGR